VFLNLLCAMEVHFSTFALSLTLTSKTEWIESLIEEIREVRKEEDRYDFERK
jgi:hypothetical protein